MNRPYIKYLGILAIVAVVVTVGMGMYEDYNHKVRMKGFESIKLVLETDQTVITSLILDDIESYHKLRDMIMDFEPLNEDELILHRAAVLKIIRALEDAKEILEDIKEEMEGQKDLITGKKETISL